MSVMSKCILLMGVAVTNPISAAPLQVRLAAPNKRVDLPGPREGEARYWNKDYLVTFQHDASPDQPAVTIYDRDGSEVGTATVWPDGSKEVIINGAAITEERQIIVSGGAMDDKGAVAYFIATVNGSGKLDGLLRTNPFVPKRICAAPDGSIWAVGFDREVDEGHSHEDYALLRHLNFDHKVRETLIPRSTLQLPSSVYPGGGTEIRCNSREVAIYTGDDDEWITYDYRAKKVSYWKLPAFEKSEAQITGIALAETGAVYATIKKSGDMSIGLYQLKLSNGGIGEWIPVPGTVAPLNQSRVGILLGVDGNNLVYQASYNEWEQMSKQTLSFARVPATNTN